MMKFGRLSDLVNNRITLSTIAVMRFSLTDRGVQELILDLNREAQLFNEGVDISGNIAGYYSNLTEALTAGITFRGKEKLAGTPYFFFDTGSLFDSFFIRIHDDGIIVGATDIEKLENVIEDVTQLLGLTTESKEILITEIIPDMRDFILKKLLS